MVNIHQYGEQLQSMVRSEAAAHSVSYRRAPEDGPTIEVGPFNATASPIEQMLLDAAGLDITDQERSFYFDVDKISGEIGYPEVGDLIILHDPFGGEDTQWRVLPQGENYAWRWHGQLQLAFHVKTKQF